MQSILCYPNWIRSC